MNNSIYREGNKNNNRNQNQGSDFLNNKQVNGRSESPMGQTQVSQRVSSNTPQQAKQKDIKNERYGMSSGAWEITLSITEKFIDVIKATMMIGGILSASLADVIFGAAGITILFGGSSSVFSGTPVWIIGLILSMGASSIQIFLWSLIQKRGITLYQLSHWKKIPSDVKTFLALAFLVWGLDTLIDVSPIALLVQNSEFETIGPVYNAMIVAVSIIVFILCGFSEVMVSNLRGMLTGSTESSSNSNQSQRSYSSDTRLPASLPRK